MATVSSISNILNQIKNPARASRFVVNIGKTEFTNQSEYLCHTAQLPGKTYASLEQKTYGPIEKFPYLATYNDLDLTFYVEGNQNNIHKKFIDWMQKINPIDTNDFAYRNEYSALINVIQYDDLNQVIRAVRFINAYPLSMNQLDLDWSSESFQNLNVTFAYTYWENIL